MYIMIIFMKSFKHTLRKSCIILLNNKKKKNVINKLFSKLNCSTYLPTCLT
jgi:hypothetical protein